MVVGGEEMNEIKTEDYPVLIGAVERYISVEQSPSVHAVCAILGIDRAKKVECLELSIINSYEKTKRKGCI